MTRLLYIGNFRPSHSTENHVAATFRSLGWDVAQAQQDELSGRAAWAALSTRAREADLVLYTKTHRWGLDANMARTLWATLSRLEIPTASLHLDLYWGIPEREVLFRDDPLFTVRHVFTADGDPHPWDRYGIRHRWLRAGVFADEAFPGAPDEKWSRYKVAFIGSSVGYHRQWPYRERMLAALGSWFGDDLLVYPRRGQSALRGWALNDLYASVPVIVGDTMSFAKEKARYWSDRVYETLGRGGYLIMPRIDELQRELAEVPSVEWYEWGDFDELIRKVQNAVDAIQWRPSARASAVDEGSRWIRHNATYTHRVVQMLDALRLPYKVPSWLEPA